MTEFLTNNFFVSFEKVVVESFLRYLKIALVFDTCYTHWLLIKLRATDKPTGHLVLNYLKKDFIVDSKVDKLTLYRILQLLSFARSYNTKKEFLNQECYYTFSFPLSNFTKRIGLDPFSSHHRDKLKTFFQDLQKLPAIYKWFDAFEFKCVLLFPVIRIKNQTSKHTPLIVQVSISESLYNMKYPYHFPDSFFTFQGIYDLKLKFAIMESMVRQPSSRKVFQLEDLFKRLNYTNESNMKKNIIQQFQHLKYGKFIQNQFYLVQKDEETIHVKQLTTKLIGPAKQLIFYEII